MNYTLLWLPRAETQLLGLYIRAADKDILAASSARIEEILARDPTDHGESRETLARRIWFYRPLCLYYAVDASAKVVYVVGVKWVGR